MEGLGGWAGIIIEAAVTLLGFGAMWGAIRQTLATHSERFNQVDGRIDKVETALVKMQEVWVAFARQEERYNALNAVVIAQGLRLDSTHQTMANRIDTQSNLIAGRLEAINAIVQGHTNQITTMLSKGSKAA